MFTKEARNNRNVIEKVFLTDILCPPPPLNGKNPSSRTKIFCRRPLIGPIYHYVLMKHRPDQVELQKLSRSSRILLKSFAQLRIENGILLRATKKFQQIVLPTCFHDMVYTELHDRMAHLGVERVLDLAIQRFYWP